MDIYMGIPIEENYIPIPMVMGIHMEIHADIYMWIHIPTEIL